MTECLNDIVSVGLCDDEVSTSGLRLMDAAGMSPVNGAKILTEQYGTAAKFFDVKKKNAITFFSNDFIGFLQANKIVSTLSVRKYDSAYFDVSAPTDIYNGYRGILLTGKQTGRLDGLKKFKIKGIQCYPLSSGEGTIVIKDFVNGIETETVLTVNFVANTLNTFDVDYTCINERIAVLVDQSERQFAGSVITCQNGCGGRTNLCASAEGFNGTQKVRASGFGLNVQFSCDCDYEVLICNFAKAFTGELIWLKWQELVYEDMYKSNRFTSWTVYNREDLWNNIIPDIRNRYAAKFQSMISAGMLEMLKQYNDPCLNCRGIKVITNI